MLQRISISTISSKKLKNWVIPIWVYLSCELHFHDFLSSRKYIKKFCPAFLTLKGEKKISFKTDSLGRIEKIVQNYGYGILSENPEKYSSSFQTL